MLQTTSRIQKITPESGSVAAGSNSGRRTRWKPTIHVETTKHSVVLRAGLAAGLVQTDDESLATVYWTDATVAHSRVLALDPWQRINHFPGMHLVCHKDYLARTLARMKALFPDEYAFTPRTWCMRTDRAAFVADAAAKRARAVSSGREKWYIAKPDSSSRGRGIYLFSDPADYVENGEEEMVVQEYVDRPFLIDGYKFDLRVYALVTHCDPMRVYVYREGLARFATEPYGRGPSAENQHRVCMHLTNYSVNKRSNRFVDGGTNAGSKRTLTWALHYLDQLGHDGTGAVWSSIKSLIAKSLLPIQPDLARTLRASRSTSDPLQDRAAPSPCFELVGFDILLDHRLRPYVLEINHSPSLSVETDVDHRIKQGMLETIFAMLNLKALNPSRATKAARKEAKQRLYSKAVAPSSSSPLPPVPSAPDVRGTSPPIVVESQPQLPEVLLPVTPSELDVPDGVEQGPTTDLYTPSVESAIPQQPPPWCTGTAYHHELAHRGQFEPVLPAEPGTPLATLAEAIVAASERHFAIPDTAASRARRRVREEIMAATHPSVSPPPFSVPDPSSRGVGARPESAPPIKLSARAVRGHAERRIAEYLSRRRGLEEGRYGRHAVVAVRMLETNHYSPQDHMAAEGMGHIQLGIGLGGSTAGNNGVGWARPFASLSSSSFSSTPSLVSSSSTGADGSRSRSTPPSLGPTNLLVQGPSLFGGLRGVGALPVVATGMMPAWADARIRGSRFAGGACPGGMRRAAGGGGGMVGR
ncbi:tubulin-tyrosine ligase family-domain-containing protein [Blastocladiella britannica]|nr:tubulin-tyrosine ligase family-domain-containing protein [Blastocladiella britannica]